MGQNSLITKGIEINAGLNIDKNDIVTIKVSKVERELNMALIDAQKRLKDAEKERKRLETEFDSLNKNEANRILAEVLASLKIAAAASDNKPKINDVGYRLEEDGKFTASVSFGGVVLQKEALLTEAQRSMRVAIATNAETIANAQQDVVNYRQKLSKLPTLERQYRAALVEAQLSKSEDGKALLAALEQGDISKDILALPGA